MASDRVMARNKWPIADYRVAEGVVGFSREELRQPKIDIKCTLKMVTRYDVPTPGVRELADSTHKGLVPTNAGMGWSYFMHWSLGERKSIFKPLDEGPESVNDSRGKASIERVGLKLETIALDEKSQPVNDPRGKVSIERVGLKLGTVVGEGYIREVAAYLLDHPREGERGNSRVDSTRNAGNT
ncbi:phosphatidylinositol 4-kinase gamma 3 [Artemisia annua]|uniref:1-phosphatidylinositol 4-kinase n=1 Tax=Artemisia annua TaxID=35608 RepID=A0A2U1MGG3_ARTAN|nr:phosphatidylinositol 4-kinase gamma 3 [Artemisia annua]